MGVCKEGDDGGGEAAAPHSERCPHGIRLPWECKDCLYGPEVPASVSYRPVRPVVPLDLVERWPKLEELARQGLEDEARQGELMTWLREARDIIGQWCDPRRLRATSDRALLNRSHDFLGKVRICCQCGGVGEVRNLRFKGNPETSDLMVPVSWVCVVCRCYVCINCALTISGSVPVEVCDDTLCSVECQTKLAEQESRWDWE